MSSESITRRTLIKRLSCLAAGSATWAGLSNRTQAQPAEDRRFLIVLTASGGASLIDAFLAIRASESSNAARLNTFPDDAVQDIPGSPLRAVDLSASALGALPVPFAANQSSFVRKHSADMLVVTQTGTSVNHAVAQRRAITGNEAWAGRTLQECVAAQYGTNLLLPNILAAASTGFIDRGNDPSIPSHARGELVAEPALWPLSLDGSKGIKGAPRRQVIEMARRLRNDRLEPASPFVRRFSQSSKLAAWRSNRSMMPTLETADLISKLMFLPESSKYPLSAYGLQSANRTYPLAEYFAHFESDPLEAQAALAFLLLASGVSATVTIGPSFNGRLAEGVDLNQPGGLQLGDLVNPPIAFDFSHQSHRATQAFMWDRILKIADGLIQLLKGVELANGISMWDRTMIYVATDFGREKVRPPNAEGFGSSHDLNNGYLIISPMARGNTVLGGVDPQTGLTFGFDPITGAPDRGRTMTEAEIFSGLLEIMNIDKSGANLPPMPAMRRS